MLNSKSIEKIINEEYSNVVSAAPNVLRCERLANHKKVAVYYFDYANRLLDVPDLIPYQDKILGKIFFSNPGPIQWNYYLTFIVDEILIDSEKKRRIEGDVKYTRKYVITPGELREFVSFKKIPSGKNLKASNDLLGRWAKKLNAAGLGGIYTDKPRTRVRDAYLEGEKEKTAPSAPITKLGTRVKPQPALKRIRFTKFRPWPKQNDFELGKVTLLHGPNGVGKTSLLEAIELYYCGKTKRNPDVDETSSDISILFYDSSRSKRFTKLTTKQYQALELNWYGKHTSYGNTLHNSFNQFNFFNSDAAFTLSQDNDRDDIEEALSSLALGDEANKISKKIEQYHGEFGRDKTSLENQLQKLEASLEENKKELAELEKQSFDQPIQVLKRTSAILKAVKYKFKDLDTPSSRRQVTTNIRQSTSSAKALINEIDWTGVVTEKTLSDEEEKCRSALTTRDKKDFSLSKATEQKGQYSLKQQQIISSIELLKDLKK